MSTTPERSVPPSPTAPPDQGERWYLFVCLGALLVLLLVLLGMLPPDQRAWALLPVLIGVAGLVLRWRVTPFLVLLPLGSLLLAGAWMRWTSHIPRTLNDLALCGATLAFFVGHYRLHALTTSIFPRDPRRRNVRPARPGESAATVRFGPVQERRRSERLVTGPELALLLGSLPFWAGLTHFLYPELVPGGRPGIVVPREWIDQAPDEIARSAGNAAGSVVEFAQRSRRLIWGFGGGVLVVATVIGYLKWRRMTPEEAAIVLQDTVWTETRREERKINRWLAWRWLRLSRREERS